MTGQCHQSIGWQLARSNFTFELLHCMRSNGLFPELGTGQILHSPASCTVCKGEERHTAHHLETSQDRDKILHEYICSIALQTKRETAGGNHAAPPKSKVLLFGYRYST